MSEQSMRVVLEPGARAWPRTLPARGDAEARRFREQLGLATDRPVVMSGHQLTVWHPGILAKFMAAQTYARRIGAACGWVGVDQDSEVATEVRFPVMGADEALGVEVYRLRAGDGADVAAAALPVETPKAPPVGGETLDSVRHGLSEIYRAWAVHAAAPNAALQAGRSLLELITPWIEPAPAFLATAIAKTHLFQSLMERFGHEAKRAIEIYNTAAASVPEAGVHALRCDSAGVELPVWALTPGMPRKRVLASDLARVDASTLAPRALLMTGLLRWAGCDLFVHGTGGAIYDRVTERWFREWLGITLAPTTMVTADVFLPLEGAGVTPETAAKAHWRAHRAWHDPVILGDEQAGNTKRQLVARIAARREAGERPLDDYTRMHSVLDGYRTQNASALSELKADARKMSRLVEAAEVARDRTWAFPLHEPAAIATLQKAIEREFAP